MGLVGSWGCRIGVTKDGGLRYLRLFVCLFVLCRQGRAFTGQQASICFAVRISKYKIVPSLDRFQS